MHFTLCAVIRKPLANYSQSNLSINLLHVALLFSFMLTRSRFHPLFSFVYSLCLLLIRLDYCGIALLIMGSFVPWLYYGFYCHYEHKLVYLTVVLVLGVLSIIVSLYDKFSEPNLRPLRTGRLLMLEKNSSV